MIRDQFQHCKKHPVVQHVFVMFLIVAFVDILNMYRHIGVYLLTVLSSILVVKV